MGSKNKISLSDYTESTLLKLIETEVDGNFNDNSKVISKDILVNALESLTEGFDEDQLSLMNCTIQEIRNGFKLFNEYKSVRKVTIYGSARTSPDHSDYSTAREFSRCLASEGWMSITGAGDGIMKAGHEGPKRKASFGLSIRLPFEVSANSVIDGDEKLLHFKYFFTRKLMFMAHADAIAVFPGGFGTQDELFEALTLIQTGKSLPVPLILLEGEGGSYWKDWEVYIRKQLLERGMISEGDPDLWYRAPNIKMAVEYITSFYKVYHSMRYIGKWCILRLEKTLTPDDLEDINNNFGHLLESGKFEGADPCKEERAYLEKPRIRFHSVRKNFSARYKLIEKINKI